MEKKTILNANNESMQVEVVRYFHEGDNKYFIFSLHEVDAQGHMNIYVTKLNNQNGALIGSNIIDDVEWSNLKTNLQRIIKENRSNGNSMVNDLPLGELANIKVLDRRALKLLANSVDMLNLGYQKNNNSINEGIAEIETVSSNNIQNVSENSNQTINNPIQMQQTTQPNNGLDIFNTQANPTTPSTVQQNVKTSNNNVSDNYKELYFQEKENNEKLMEEKNKLINELNNCKMIISDIKNVLSR